MLMLRKLFTLVVTFAIVFTTGCGTIYTQHTIHNPDDKDEHWCYRIRKEGIHTPVYSGAYYDLNGLAGTLLIPGYFIFAPFILADMPLSLAADTIILPYSIWYKKRFECTSENYFSPKKRSSSKAEDIQPPKITKKRKAKAQISPPAEAVPIVTPLYPEESEE